MADASQSGSVRLTYFAGHGLAEPTRWTLAAAGIQWEQVALTTHEQFQQLKDDGMLLFGQLPLLEMNGLKLTQSQSMARYVARVNGLVGKTPEEEVMVDMVCEALKDAKSPLVGLPFNPNKDEVKAALPSTLSKMCSRVEAILGNNAGFESSPSLFASGVTVADVYIAELFQELIELDPLLTVPYPRMVAVHKRVIALPGVASYLQSANRYPYPTDPAVCAAYVDNVATVLGRK
eukprot:TRINITY_DN3050_c0_g1_i1.p1 TRINITY_DN3050_c0_g1~~TRINITY_DN3050_c0_g1_i1.p1  ORF type:complete len:234 (+),score=33.98 TRINITY_DN3050_c0_g1_i1:63-764(+)